MNLYFLSSTGEKRLISTEVNADNVYKTIKDYIYELNPDYEIYYIRSWGNIEHEGITYDVGSHTEFFLLTKEMQPCGIN